MLQCNRFWSGKFPPDVFIPIAEESGLIIALGNWITANAARIAASWPDDVTPADNLPPVQISAPDAALGILAALRDAGLPTHRLELEITESALTDAFMADLRNVGAGSNAVICAVSEMAARLDMGIVAEGIETIEQERANLSQLRLVI